MNEWQASPKQKRECSAAESVTSPLVSPWLWGGQVGKAKTGENPKLRTRWESLNYSGALASAVPLWKGCDLPLPLFGQQLPEPGSSLYRRSLILPAARPPFQGGSLPPLPHSHRFPGHTSTLLIPPHVRDANAGSSTPPPPSNTLSHSLSWSHCPQHSLVICNSIFKAPIVFCRDFCQTAYQHVIIACLHVSLPAYPQRSLKTAFLVLQVPCLRTAWHITGAQCMFPRWMSHILFIALSPICFILL